MLIGTTPITTFFFLYINYDMFVPSCDYIFSGERGAVSCNSHSELNILTLNINSLPLHIDDFMEQCLYTCNSKFHVLSFCETRLNDSLCNLFPIPGYQSFFNNRNTHGGGVAIYLCNTLQGQVLDDLSLQIPHLQSLFVEILQP